LTKSAQIIGILSALFILIIGGNLFVSTDSLSIEETTLVEGVIATVDCPRKYSSTLTLEGDSSKYYLAKEFREITHCHDKNMSISLIGQSVNMAVNLKKKVYSLKLNNREIYSIDDYKANKLMSSKVLILIPLILFSLVWYKGKKQNKPI